MTINESISTLRRAQENFEDELIKLALEKYGCADGASIIGHGKHTFFEYAKSYKFEFYEYGVGSLCQIDYRFDPSKEGTDMLEEF